MIDMQLINNALTIIAIACGAVIFAAISIVATAGGLRHRAATRHRRPVAVRKPRTAMTVHVPALR